MMGKIHDIVYCINLESFLENASLTLELSCIIVRFSSRPKPHKRKATSMDFQQIGSHKCKGPLIA